MSKTLRLTADPDGIARAAALLGDGALVAFPTETVYGLGADARNDQAVAGIFAAKGRPQFNPLIVHVANRDLAERHVALTGTAARLAEAFWPGPLTLVLPLRPDAGIAPLVTAGLGTVGIRVPAHPAAQALLTKFGGPVAAPSANPSGRISPTAADHVLAGLDGRIGAVLDDGPCGVGLESTIVGFDETGRARLLRPGGITAEDIAGVLGERPLPPEAGGKITSPGQLLSHYAPRGRVRLNATAPEDGEVMIGFGPVPGDTSLSESGDLAEAAANLFRMLHLFDTAEAIAVAPVPEEGLGAAINDRLRRAAAPRN
ncbi:translation factor Sua5 [Oceanicola sp. 22II-s10i]|uniref:L-threonylcarbamoyladenylate synthase n=1 Tax=Oceanicola sp. 22II-s10i TaxID=1317116 RepID=UPI000B5258B6|nr:L-threonylcarbamoyladenylate synthase [Oceanicola sp. 22II-s10i]OWU85435.1 translation factor Sua5 [Oceanicola sp. 22II-s10i]